MAVTHKQRLIGIAVMILTIAAIGIARSFVAETGTGITDSPRRACVEASFEWRWNVAFAATCDAQPD